MNSENNMHVSQHYAKKNYLSKTTDFYVEDGDNKTLFYGNFPGYISAFICIWLNLSPL